MTFDPTTLSEEEHPEKISSLLQDCLRDLRRSRSSMAKNYEDWDYSLDTYRQNRSDDAKDIRAKKQREPAKQTIPLTYAQVNTFVTFITLLFTQNPRIFELSPTGTEDFALREIIEKILEREMRANTFTPKLVAFLLDVARFNLGIFKLSYETETVEIPASTDLAFNAIFSNTAGLQLVQESNGAEEVIVSEGTKIYNVSPYNWFYDTRLPVLRWEEGRFAADEQVMHVDDVRGLDGVYGVEHLNPFDSKTWESRNETRLEGLDPTMQKGVKEDDFMVVITEMQRKLIPKDYGLGESSKPEMWAIRIANDQRIISLEKVEDANMCFTYKVAQMSPDLHAKLSDSLSSLIDKLQETVTWLMNTRIEAVKNNIEKQLVIHSQYVELEDLQTRSPFIRLKKNTPMMGGLDNFITQLKTNDPTVTHINDAETLIRMMQMVSGVNENAMGSFHGGRRSATEARNVAAGGAARVKLIASTIHETAIAPLGKHTMINARQWMTAETFFKIVGEDEETMELYSLFHKENWWELIGNEDFFVFDGTAASEKAFVAQSLQELVVALIGNPEVAASMNLDLTKMITRIQELRGVTNLKQFEREQPIGLPIPGQVPGAPPAAGPIPQLPVALPVS